MYHYVREHNDNTPYFKALNIEDFRKQLDFFEQEYGIANYEDISNLKKGILTTKVYLTFDDGVSDHFQYVFPELVKRNISGIFYIPTLPYVQNKILDVHKTHLILGSTEAHKVLETLNTLILPEMLEHHDEFEKETYIYQTNDKDTLRTKRILNYYLSYKYRSQILSLLFEKFVGNESEHVKCFYMTTEQIEYMSKNKMFIGSHSINHPVFSRLNEAEQKEEIIESFKFLNTICNVNTLKTFCFPYGGSASYNDITLKILEDENCDFCFSVDPFDIDEHTFELKKQHLPRYDCNQFKFGQCR